MKKFIKKLLVILILIISYMVINIIFENENFSAFAVNQTVSTDINSIDSNQYPQIKEMLQTLKNQHPNWNFKILYTDIEWNEAIANEYVGHKSSPRNLVTANNSKYDGEWICKVCGETKYDNGNMCIRGSNCVYDGSKKFNKLFRRISIYAIIICRMQYSNSKGNGCWNFFE